MNTAEEAKAIAEAATPEWLAIVQYRYLHEPEFHAMVEYAVQERLRSIEQDRWPRLAEIERCATGVVHTAHADITKDMVVMEWWQSLKRALAEPR